MRTARRFLRWLGDSLPLYSNRRLSIEWFRGQEFALKQLGITRDAKGRFIRVTPFPQ